MKVKDLRAFAASVLRDRGASLPERLDASWEAWVGAFPDVIPSLGMDWRKVTDLESRRRLIWPLLMPSGGVNREKVNKIN